MSLKGRVTSPRWAGSDVDLTGSRLEISLPVDQRPGRAISFAAPNVLISNIADDDPSGPTTIPSFSRAEAAVRDRAGFSGPGLHFRLRRRCRRLRRLRPDILVLDLRMPGKDLLCCVKCNARRWPRRQSC